MPEKNTNLPVESDDLAETRTNLARERTRAIQEQTLVAWIRTSLIMMSLGFALERFFHYLGQTAARTEINQITEGRIIGLSLMSLGIFSLAAALVMHWRIRKNLEQKAFKYSSQWSQGFTVGVILLFIGLAAFVPLLSIDVRILEIFTFNSQVIKNLIALNVFLIMLIMGVKIPLENLISLKNHPQFLGKSLLSIIVIFPLIVALILLVLHPGKYLALSLILLAASPAPPLLTRRSMMSGGNVKLAASLQVILSLLAVGVTPGILYLFTIIFPKSSESINFLLVARQVATVQLLPLSVGLLIRKLSSDLGEEIGNLLINVANTLFLVVIIFVLGVSINVIPLAGWQAVISIALIVTLGLTIGHLLGGIDESINSRSTLATATTARNVGLALYIAVVNGATAAIPGIVAYAVLGAIFALPYNIWSKNKMKLAAKGK